MTSPELGGSHAALASPMPAEAIVAVLGARGRMGATVCEAIAAAPDLILGAALDVGDALGGLLGADVCVVFTAAGQADEGLAFCAANGISAVIGTTGFDAAARAKLAADFAGPAHGKPNAALVPNFAIGAVLLMRLAALAAPHFETAEIIESHHEHKVDAPSGTAMATATAMAAARRAAGVGSCTADPTTRHVLEGSRGAEAEAGIRVHAVRMRGMVASQEVVLGTEGQWLTLRHDTSSRASFMPGVLLAVRKVVDTPGFTFGLEPFLGL